jgi:hypothetical protein
MDIIKRGLDARENENRLRDFGHTTTRSLTNGASYAALTQIDSMRKVVADPASKFHYKALLDRFLADDATLTPEEMYMLMIGYSALPDYNPFNYNDISALKMFASVNTDTAIARGIAMIPSNPINPSLYREIMYCYRRNGDSVNAARYQARMQRFFTGMMFSGDGSCTRPYVSLWGKEEYNFISYIGLNATESHSMENCAGQMSEKITATDAADTKSDLYFNVKLIFMQTTGR